MTKKKSNKAPQGQARVPNAKISELYGRAPDTFKAGRDGHEAARLCPVRGTVCDVSANRHRTAFLDLDHPGISLEEREELLIRYGDDPLPLGICSVWTRRQNESVARPWMLCPNRLLMLDPPTPVIPKEVRGLIDIPVGSRVGVWRELKLRRLSDTDNAFFEYTFDFLLMEIDESNYPVGVPYVIEVMTSSTRGGGLTEHMVDVLLGRDQRYLGNVVKSIYTPNYRQVFERMLGQFIAKSEIAERWGGKTIWVFQDVLLDYIEQTTAFDSSRLEEAEDGNVFAEVYRLASVRGGLKLVHHKSLSGKARLMEEAIDYTSMLGLGYAPSVNDLKQTLLNRSQNSGAGKWFSFIWGEELDPTSIEV